MSKIKTSNSDVIWSYISTVLSMGSSFILLPFLLFFLTDEELGLWYTFVAIGNLALLFEFGFTPTFARNVVYVVSGARRLTKSGYDEANVEAGIDFCLLSSLIKTSKIVYGVIACVTLLLVVTIGSVYVSAITMSIDGMTCWISWGIFCVAIFLNLYFFHYTTCLRGFGDVAAESKAKSYGRIAQLVLSAVLFMCGAGLVGAAFGYLINGVALRYFSHRFLCGHADILDRAKENDVAVGASEVKETFANVVYLAWRDGLVQLSCYASTQASSLLCSYCLGLTVSAEYSLLVQVGGAIYGFASAYVRAHVPMFQSSYAEGDWRGSKIIVERSLSLYWLLIVACTVGVWFIGFPILAVVKDGFNPSPLLYIALTVYLAVWNHHSLCCNFIVSTNEIPYLFAYVVSAIAGIGLSVALLLATDLGIWSIVLGTAVAQLTYNNWKWPRYLSRKLGSTYFSLMAEGMGFWLKKLRSAFDHS